MTKQHLQSLAQRDDIQSRDAPVLVGCFSSSKPLRSQGTYQYQSSGYCSGICTSRNEGVVGLSSGDECWCGNELPAEDTKVLDARCNTPCQGYGIEDCGGGDYYFTVWLTGLQDNVPSYDPNTTSTVISTTPSATSTTATTAATATNVGGATTTQKPSSPHSSDLSTKHHGPSDKTIAIIIGVGVSIVAAVIIGLILCCLWRRKKRTGTLRKRPSTLLSFGSRPSSWASIAPDARISILAGSRKWEGRLSATPRRSRQVDAVQDPLPLATPDENPFYTPDERRSSSSSRDDGISDETAAARAEIEPESLGHGRPLMSELNAYPRGSPLPTVLFPGRPGRSGTLKRQQSQLQYASPLDEDTPEVDVVSPLAPVQPFNPTRPPRMVHYPSWSEVSEFDFATNHGNSIERKPVPGWHPWRERKDGRYELA